METTLVFDKEKIKRYVKRMRKFDIPLTFGELHCPGRKPQDQPPEEPHWYAMFIDDVMREFEDYVKEKHTVGKTVWRRLTRRNNGQ